MTASPVYSWLGKGSLRTRSLARANAEGWQDAGGTRAPLELCSFDVTGFSKQMPVAWSAGKNRKLVAAGLWFQKSSAIIKLFSTLNIT